MESVEVACAQYLAAIHSQLPLQLCSVSTLCEQYRVQGYPTEACSSASNVLFEAHLSLSFSFWQLMNQLHKGGV